MFTENNHIIQKKKIVRRVTMLHIFAHLLGLSEHSWIFLSDLHLVDLANPYAM